MQVKIKKLHSNAIIPSYQSLGAGAFDLHSVEGSYCYQGGPTIVRTGLAFEIPEGHVMLVFSRSGHGFKEDVRLANCVGVIDSDYRGEVKVKLTKDSHEYFYISSGDRIAQAIILPFEQAQFVVVDELGSTERGEKGFGSTG